MTQPTLISISRQIGGMVAGAKVRDDSWSTVNDLEYLAHVVATLDNTITGRAACKQAFQDAYQKERSLYPATKEAPTD